MTIYTCDVCEKKIELRDQVMVSVNFLDRYTFCKECGDPILNFLSSKNLFKDTTDKAISA